MCKPILSNRCTWPRRIFVNIFRQLPLSTRWSRTSDQICSGKFQPRLVPICYHSLFRVSASLCCIHHCHTLLTVCQATWSRRSESLCYAGKCHNVDTWSGVTQLRAYERLRVFVLAIVWWQVEKWLSINVCDTTFYLVSLSIKIGYKLTISTSTIHSVASRSKHIMSYLYYINLLLSCRVELSAL